MGRARSWRSRGAIGVLALAASVSGCAGAGALSGGGANATTVTIAIVSNSQMQDAVSLSPQFEREHPDIKLKFVTLAENEAGQRSPLPWRRRAASSTQ